VLAARVAELLAAIPGVARVAVDGAPAAEPDRFAASLIEPLLVLGRPAVRVSASSFWRDASLRLEHGREDAEAYRGWLDVAALRREVLDAAVRSGNYLPSLRDPSRNRSTRAQPRPVDPALVLIVSGSLLLGRGLPFEQTIHLALSPAARARRTPPDQAWTLPAFTSYDADVRPADTADAVIKLDDPRHPAMRWT
jgi:hypothetical protein